MSIGDDDDVEGGLPRDPRIRHVAPVHSKRQSRGQAVLVLLCLFGIAYITLKNHDFVTKDVGGVPARTQTLDETLGAISPFAKKKVPIHSISHLMHSVRTYTPMQIPVPLSSSIARRVRLA
jgi:hypothetical protein